MSASQHRKGRGGENEFARLIGGERISSIGKPGPDVEGLGLVWEVKRRRDGFRQLYGWLAGDGVDALAVRSDHQQWLVVVPLPTYLNVTQTAST